MNIFTMAEQAVDQIVAYNRANTIQHPEDITIKKFKHCAHIKDAVTGNEYGIYLNRDGYEVTVTCDGHFVQFDEAIELRQIYYFAHMFCTVDGDTEGHAVWFNKGDEISELVECEADSCVAYFIDGDVHMVITNDVRCAIIDVVKELDA